MLKVLSRDFSSSINKFDKFKRRGHIKLNQVPKPPISRVNTNKQKFSNTEKFSFKSLNVSDKIKGDETRKNLKDERIDSKFSNLIKWRESIESKKVDVNSSNEICEILGKVSNNYEYKSELSVSKFEFLRKSIRLYDRLYGPVEDGGSDGDGESESDRLILPDNIKEGLLQCRKFEDWDNMIRLYDYYFKLILNNGLKTFKAERQNMIKLVNIKSDEKIMSEKIKLREELNLKDVKEIEERWYKLDVPRNLSIFNSDYNKLVKILNNEKNFNKFSNKFISEFFSDLIESKIGINYEEYLILIKKIDKQGWINKEIYKNLREEFKNNDMIITPKIYKELVKISFKKNNYELVNKIILDFENEEGYIIDRDMINILIKYYSFLNDKEMIYKIIKFGIEDLNIIITEEEIINLIESLIRVGDRGGSFKILKNLILMNEDLDKSKFTECKSDEKKFSELEDGYLDIDIINNTLNNDKVIGDINKVKTIIRMKSEMLIPIIITSSNYEEGLNILKMVQEEERGNFEISSELGKVMVILLSEEAVEGEIKYSQVQRLVVELFETMDVLEIGKMVNDVSFTVALLKCVDAHVTAAANSSVASELFEASTSEVVASFGKLTEFANLSSGGGGGNGGGNGNRSSRKDFGDMLRHTLVVCGIEA